MSSPLSFDQKIYLTVKQINGYDSPETGVYTGYITAGKTFKILEEKNGWLKIKITMPDGGDYGWEGWIRRDDTNYKVVNSID